MDSAIHIPRISHDLVCPVFEHLENDKTSLCVVSLVSSTFRDEAQRILFRNVNPTTYTSHIKFLCTVAASATRLALFVRAYRQWWTYDTLSVEEFMTVLPNVVADGLKAMHYLKRLDISMYTRFYGSHHTYIQILSECTFSLERFDWEVHQRTSDELVEKFLARQPTLRHLGLMYNASLADKQDLVSATICPQLVSATVGWNMLKTLLPRHNISTLMLKGWDEDMTDVNIEPLAGKLKHVKAFSISFPFLTEAKILDHGFLRYCPSVNVLEIYCMEYYDEDGYIRIQLPELVSVLSELPALHTLVLSGPLQERDEKEDLKLALHVFAKLGKHLKCIDIEISGKESYARYIQSREIAQEISKEEARKLWLTSS